MATATPFAGSNPRGRGLNARQLEIQRFSRGTYRKPATRGGRGEGRSGPGAGVVDCQEQGERKSVGRGRGFNAILECVPPRDKCVGVATASCTGVGRGRGATENNLHSRGRDSRKQRQQKDLNKHKKLPTYHLSGGVTTGSTILEANRASKQTSVEKKSKTLGGEIGSDESCDSRMERLGRFLTTNLNFDSDSGDDMCVFDGGGVDTRFDEVLLSDEDDCLRLSSLTNPTITASTAVNDSHHIKSVAAEPTASSTSHVLIESRSCESEMYKNAPQSEHCLDDEEDFYFAQFDNASGQSEGGTDPSVDRQRCSSNVSVKQSLFEEQDVEHDDGWLSDNSDFANDSHTSLPAPDLPPYAMYEDDVWVDEAKAVFAKHKKENTKELQDLLREMFCIHTDVYSLMTAFVRRAGKTRHPPKSLPRITLATFKKWLKEGERGERKPDMDKHPQRNPPILSNEHKENVLLLMTKSNLVLMDDLCEVFQLHSASKDLLINLVQDLITDNKRKEAVTYAWTFHLQSYFSIDDMLLPLIAMDKINVIEYYIEEDREIQEEFVMLLDRLCHSGGKLLASYAQRLGLEVNEPNSKMSSKQLFKLALRLVKMFNLQLSKFPGLSSQHLSMCLHHLFKMRYSEKIITDSNMDDIITAAVSSHPGLQHHLVRELIRMGDNIEAAHWAQIYHIPTNTLPLEIQLLMMRQTSRNCIMTERGRSSTEHLQLSLPLDRVHFVDTADSLQRCHDRLTQKGALIGVDAEWRLPICNGGEERMAVMQLALNDTVYLLDMLALPQRIPQSKLRSFIRDIFANNSTIKLGYSIEGDMDLHMRSWPFVADILSSPVKVIDIKTLAAMVANLPNQVHTPIPVLPPHPLLSTQSGRPPQSLRPPYPTQNPSNQKHKAPHHPKRLPKPAPHTRSSPGLDIYDDPLSLEGSLETGQHRGLSLLVQSELGRPLDKTQQISDWEKRPLTLEQIRYAALDAVCLLQLYTILTTRALTIDPNFNTQPTIPPLRQPVKSRKGKETLIIDC